MHTPTPLEPLEPRVLLSASTGAPDADAWDARLDAHVTVDAKKLIVRGTPGDDTVRLRWLADPNTTTRTPVLSVTLTINGQRVTGTQRIAPTIADAWTQGSLQTIDIRTRGGHDTVELAGPGSALRFSIPPQADTRPSNFTRVDRLTLRTGWGHDAIDLSWLDAAGPAPNPTHRTPTRLDTGTGDDRLSLTGLKLGDASIHLRAGNDTVNTHAVAFGQRFPNQTPPNRSAGVAVRLGAGHDSARVNEPATARSLHILGGRGNDFLQLQQAGGTASPDRAPYVGDHHFTLRGGQGNDTLHARLAPDLRATLSLRGNAGQDRLLITGRSDSTIDLRGGAGPDHFTIDADARVTLNAGPGDDTLSQSPSSRLDTPARHLEQRTTLRSPATEPSAPGLPAPLTWTIDQEALRRTPIR